MSSLLLCFVMVTVTAENPASNRWDVANGVSAVVVILGYSVITLIQDTGKVVVSSTLLRQLSIAIISSWSSCTDCLNLPGLVNSGSCIHPWKFVGPLRLGNSALTFLKTCTNFVNELAVPFPFFKETYQRLLFLTHFAR